MSTTGSSGRTATRTGHILEEFVAGWVHETGYERVTALRFFHLRALEQPIFSRQVEIGTDIYTKRRRVDLSVYHPDKWKDCLVIQCKWQAARGSVEEKYPFEVLSTQMNPYDTIIVLDGGGYSQGAERWLKSQAGKNKLRHVFDQGDFQRFASRGQL